MTEIEILELRIADDAEDAQSIRNSLVKGRKQKLAAYMYLYEAIEEIRA